MCGGDNSVLDDILSGGTQILSGGLLDTDQEGGGFKKGIVTETAENIFKDITGVTAAEEANELSKKQFEESKAAAAEQQKETKARTARDQLASSRLAAGNRRSGGGKKSGANKSAGGGDSAVTNLGSDGQDFLGL